MSQRTLLIALAILAVLIFAGIAAFIGGAGLGLTGGDLDNSRRSNHVAATGDPFADSDDPAAGIEFVGSDEHGRYYIGPGGERTYIDSSGRRYIIGPDGKRIYVDGRGRPLTGQGAGTGAEADRRQGAAAVGDGTKPPEQPDQTEEPEAAPADLSGRVVDDHGREYPGATVVAQVVGGESRSVTSTEEGAFVFKGLPSGKPLVVTARDAWGNTSKPVSTRLAKGNVVLKEPLVLPLDTAIRGVVLDAETRLPLSGAQVLLFATTGQFGQVFTTSASARTEAGGAFVFEKLTPAAYRLQIALEGYAPRILNSVEPPKQLTIDLSPGATISGTVKDVGGNPIVGARVSCDFRAEPAQLFHTEAVTDAAGFYAVKCQPESQHNTVSVIAPGYKAANRTFVRSGAQNVDFALEDSGNVVLRGRLLREDGVPLTGPTTAVWGVSFNSGTVSIFMGPDSEGRFTCEVPKHANTITLMYAGLANLSVGFTPVPGGVVDLGDLTMRVGFAVYGKVHKAEQAEVPVANATIRFGDSSTTSATDGSYRLEGLPEQPQYGIIASHPAYANLLVTVARADGETEKRVDFGLSPGGLQARVWVMEAVTLDPVAGASVTAVAYGQTVLSDAEGKATLTQLAASSVNVRVEKAGFATVEVLVPAAAADSEAAPFAIHLERGNVISGLCTSAGAALPAATRVDVWSKSKLVASVYTDTDGKYATESLPVGDYFVGLPDFHYAPRPVTLTDEGAEFDIELGLVCHARGRMFRADGTPHANAGVYVYRRDESFWVATIHTGPSGEFEVSNLYPGAWVFCALKTQGDTAAQFAVDVSLAKAGWTDVDVYLPQSTGVMTGRVTYPDGRPVKRARVAVTNLSANFPRALLAAYVVTDDDGNYTAERLENGMQMQARVGGYQDEAETGTAFSEVVTIGAGSSPVKADIVVAPSGVTVRVRFKRADAGPILTGGPLAYVYDSEGRLSGLYFGGGTFGGQVNIYDVVPGTYTVMITNRGMKRATLEFTVATQDIVNGLEVLIELEDRGE